MEHERLTAECEQAVRNHDPCISCATHFLDLRLIDGADGNHDHHHHDHHAAHPPELPHN